MGLTMRTRWSRRIIFLVLFFGGLSAGAQCSEPAKAADELNLLPVQYAIRVQHAASTTGGTCGADKWFKGALGVPTLITLNGSSLPNVSVNLTAVPTSAAGVSDLAFVEVTRHLSALTLPAIPVTVPVTLPPLNTSPAGFVAAPRKLAVEILMYPSDGKRLAFGYDGCENGGPERFNGNVQASAAQITVNATTVSPASSLKLFGSRFDALQSLVRRNPISLTARLAPVPQTLGAVVDMLPNDAYRARLTPSAATTADVVVSQVRGARRTDISARVERLPRDITLDFSEAKVGYSVAAPPSSPVSPNVFMTRLTAHVSQAIPATTTAATQSDLDVTLDNLPKSATITRTGSKLNVATGNGPIGSALVKYTTGPSGVKPPALTPPSQPQYFVGNVSPTVTALQTRILGLSRAELDSADPVIVDVGHAAGPFGYGVTQKSQLCNDRGCTNPTVITRTIDGTILNIPASAKVTYSPTTGAFTYTGSSVIGELITHVHSTVPFISNARDAHLRLVNVPTGLVGAFDAKNKSFTATLTTGAIQTVEAWVSNTSTGPVFTEEDFGLVDGQQGLLLEDRDASYDAFLRLRGLKQAAVGWGTTQSVSVNHLAGPFKARALFETLAGDPTNGLTAKADINNLPDIAGFSYTPVGDAAKVVYDGSAPIGQLVADITREKPFIAGTDVTRLHAQVTSMPRHATVTVDPVARRITADTATIVEPPVGGGVIGGFAALVAPQADKIGQVTVDLCSPQKCRGTTPTPGEIGPVEEEVDGVWLTKLTSGFDMFARISNIEDAVVGWGDTTSAKLTHDAAVFEAHTVVDKVTQVFRRTGLDIGGGLSGVWIDVPYTERLDVVVEDLPRTVDFSFNGVTGHATYAGSAPIDRITVNFTNGEQIPVATRAHWLRLVLDDVATNLTLDYAFGADKKDLTVNTGAGKIGSALFMLGSNRQVLDNATTQNLEVVRGVFDGVVAWDLDDEIAHTFPSPYLDPFLLAGHVTNLQKFSYTTSESTDPNFGTFTTQGAELTRVGTAKKIIADIRSSDSPKSSFAPFDPTIAEVYNLTTVVIDAPAPTMGFEFRKREGTGPKQYWVKAWGSHTVPSATFTSNAGALRALTATVSPIPAGTAANEGLFLCFSPNVTSCVPWDAADTSDSPLSFTVDVESPVVVTVNAEAGATKVLGTLTIDRYLAFAKKAKVEGCCPNSNIVYIDTAGHKVGAIVDTFDEGSIDISARIPFGARAVERIVEVENEGVSEGRNHGQLACPHGTAVTFHTLVNLSLNDDVCTGPSIHDVTPRLVPADNVAHDIQISGFSFAADVIVNGQVFEGTHVKVFDLNGNEAAFVRINSVRRDAIDRMIVSVTIAPADRGKWFTFVLSPNTQVVGSRSSSDPGNRTIVVNST